MQRYRAPRWLAGAGPVAGNVQTIWPALYSRVHPEQRIGQVRYVRERWDTPDGDFIDVDFLPAGAGTPSPRPLLVMFHGLEGSSQSHYSRAFALWAHAQGWDFAVPHFRGCSGEINRAPRTYHSGDHAEADWILQRLARRHAGPVLAVGISLGGNVLLRWAQEAGADAGRTVRAVVAISSPVDLAAAGHALAKGFNLQIYTRMFLQSMKPKALAKLQQHPGLFDREALLRARDLVLQAASDTVGPAGRQAIAADRERLGRELEVVGEVARPGARRHDGVARLGRPDQAARAVRRVAVFEDLVGDNLVLKRVHDF